jgi:hypothetical protein
MTKYNTLITIFSNRYFKDKNNLQNLNSLTYVVSLQDENKLNYDKLDQRIDKLTPIFNLNSNLNHIKNSTIINVENEKYHPITQYKNFKLINLNYSTFFSSEQITKFLNEDKFSKYYIFRNTNYENLLIKFRSLGILLLPPEILNEEFEGTLTPLHIKLSSFMSI